ncbi:HARBI1 [Mytilus edulis]|uniref:HARBI1 n=1 Tax=Mytilus edulis TaxID=6550 RepID=A0A8S3RDJ9_MYTED|nr:HARBI1 [Mytilus edulis]
MLNKVMGLAEQGFGISQQQMLGKTATVCSQFKLKNNFKVGGPWNGKLAGLRRRHPVLVLRKPEKLATVRLRMLNPIKVGRYFVDLHRYSKDVSNRSLEHGRNWCWLQAKLAVRVKFGKVQIIKFQREEAEQRRVKERFYDISSFPNVLGAFGGTLIPIQEMSGNDEPNYVCRKQYQAINVQAICDAELK